MITFSRLFTFLVLLVFASSSYGADKKQAEKELAELKAAIVSVQKQLQSNRKLQSKTEKQIFVADKALAKVSKQLNQTNSQIKQKNSELRKLRKEQTEKEKLSEQQKILLANQVKSAYVSGDQEYIKLLLSQKDPAKITRMLKYYDYLNKARAENIQTLQKTLERLNVIGLEIQTSLADLNQLQKIQKTQQSSKKELKIAQQKALKELKIDYKDKDKQLAQLKKNEAALQKLLSQLAQKLKNFSPPQKLVGLSKLKKKLNWPVKGKLLHKFGSSKLGGATRWNGIIISAKEGQEVRAIQQGQVVFSDWLRGFGLMTIVDHGKGYLSLYGHNQTLLKNAGDFVEPGEPIATVGQSGGFEQSSLYFEVRYKGKPKNPLVWIK